MPIVPRVQALQREGDAGVSSLQRLHETQLAEVVGPGILTLTRILTVFLCASPRVWDALSPLTDERWN